MDILYEILGCMALLGILVLGCVIQETIIKKYFPKLYAILTKDYNENEGL